MRTDVPLPRDVVVFSTADWDHPFWTNKQRVAQQLSERGFRVLYVESLGLRRPGAGSRDLGRIVRRLRKSVGGLRHVTDTLWVASPLALPWHGNGIARALNERLLAGWLKRQLARLDFRSPIVWTYNPLVGPLVDQFDRSLLVYHCVDDLSAAPHLPSDAIQHAERRLVEKADVVFSTSAALHAQCKAWNAGASRLLPNVADYDHFSRAREAGDIPADLQKIPRPRIGFVGALSAYKVDFELISAVARARPEWQWVMIGQVGEGQPETTVDSLRQPNIHLLGPRPYSELPDYLRGFDVATIPCRANPYTAAMFPLKFFEYLAANVPVVIANVPALAEFSRACETVKSAEEFVAAIDKILAGNRPSAEHCDSLARRYTWQWRMDEMLGTLQNVWHARTPLATHARAS